jgi:transposase
MRQRAQAIYWSHQGHYLSEIAKALEVHYTSVSEWLNRWKTQGLRGLYDGPRSGRPRIYTEIEAQRLRELIEQEPRHAKQAKAQLIRETGKSASRDTLKRLLKKKLRWKRCRKSLKSKRNEQAFRQCQQRLKRLHEKEVQKEINLYYFDEAGFTLTPSVPYAWQPIGQTRALPSASSRRINVLGFMNKANQSYFHSVVGPVNSDTVIAAFDQFSEPFDGSTLTLVFVDNASIHHSAAFEARREHWMAHGVVVCYLPTYSPELNLIEILWRKIKYEWLPWAAYESFAALKRTLAEILDDFGQEYQITFA